MPQTPNINDFLLNRLNNSLEKLLGDVQETETEVASIKADVANLHDEVKILSSILRDGDGGMSVVTKLALLNTQLENILKWQDQHTEKHGKLGDHIDKIKQDIAKIKTNAEQDSSTEKNQIKRQKNGIKAFGYIMLFLGTLATILLSGYSLKSCQNTTPTKTTHSAQK